MLLASMLLLGGNGQRRWSQYEREMQDPVDDPPDAWEKTEFAFGRLRYRSSRNGWYQRWGIDCNKSDRIFMNALRRLTRIHARSVEHIVDVESDEIFDWPWMYAVSVSDWKLTDAQAARLRQYFDRGGFLMVDDFHGPSEWMRFAEGLRKIYPNPDVVELPSDHPIFHTVYSMSKRIQIPGANVVHGPGYERDGVEPHWMGVLDEKRRVVIAICFNHDVGDAWEFADSTEYPEHIASEAFRLGVNYVMYAMTH
jgi:hypothetical protein